MPLKKGSSQKTISKNIGTLVRDFKESGAIGTSKPKSKTAAVKQAAAIAYEKAGKSKPAKMARGGAVKTPKGVQGPFAEVKKRDSSRLVKLY